MIRQCRGDVSVTKKALEGVLIAQGRRASGEKGRGVGRVVRLGKGDKPVQGRWESDKEEHGRVFRLRRRGGRIVRLGRGEGLLVRQGRGLGGERGGW